MDARTRAPALPSRETASVLALAAVLVAVAGVALLGAPVPAPAPLQLPWVLLAAMYAATEAVVLHIQAKREAQTVSLSELPTVLALFFAEPVELLLARLVGSVVVILVVRRSPPLKTLFNAALVAAESAVTVAVFTALTPDRAVGDPSAWLAAYAAVLAGSALAVVALALVIGVYEGDVRPRSVATDLVGAAPVPLMVTTVALVAVTSLGLDGRATVLLVAAASGLLLAYRAYAALSDRHLSLERLYRFSQVVTSSPEIDEVLRSVLTQARDLLRAESAEVLVIGTHGDARAAKVSLGGAGRLVRDEHAEVDPWLRDTVVGQGEAVLLPRGTATGRAAEWLEARGLREAIVVPLRGEAGVVGTLAVADRLGEVRPYDGSDVLLLQTVANHASIALQNSRLIDQLRHDAMHDALTGLPNRVHLQRALAAALDRVAAGEVAGAAVMVLDLDGFKDINDTLGHQQGDALLVEVAVRLRSAVDVAGEVVRLGGDEFAVLLAECEDEETALRVGRRVLAALEQPITLDGLDVEVGASVGVALSPQHATEPAALLKRADLAMYGAKGSTGGLRVFEPDLDATDPRRLTLVSELRAALQAGALDVHVQPKGDLATGEVRCVEALVRWTHPVLGAVGPDEFVPVAERSGLIQPLTSLVLGRAVAACAEWRDAGLDVGVAVNLSTRSLLDADLVHEVSRLLARHRLPGHLLTLEITESGVMADPTRAVALLHQLRERGVRLSVDDFGTGYSSLSYLKQLPVQEVKIDRGFISELRSDSDDAAIVRSIVDLGRHLGLEVVAEGVEDAETWALLHRTGCTTGQGWHLARPMPTADLPAWLRDHTPAAYAAAAVVPAPRDGTGSAATPAPAAPPR